MGQKTCSAVTFSLTPFPWEEKGCFLQFYLSLEKGALRRTLQELDMCFLECGRAQGTDLWHPSPPPPPTSHPPTAPVIHHLRKKSLERAQAAGVLATHAPLVRTQHHLPSKMLSDSDFSTLLQSGGIWDNLVMMLASGWWGVGGAGREWYCVVRNERRNISKLRREMQDFALFYHHGLPAQPGKKSSAFKSSEFYFHGLNIKKKKKKTKRRLF